MATTLSLHDLDRLRAKLLDQFSRGEKRRRERYPEYPDLKLDLYDELEICVKCEETSYAGCSCDNDA